SNISPDFSYDDRVRLLEDLYKVSLTLNEVILFIQQIEAGNDISSYITDSSEDSRLMFYLSSINSRLASFEKALIGGILK
ncbi:hypothetical protein, partial [Aeromonas caviae]|uniref:hypothetical protein n=2 Tax=Aeromonadaceae TaxID=84642 RepID=UPI00398A4934